MNCPHRGGGRGVCDACKARGARLRAASRQRRLERLAHELARCVHPVVVPIFASEEDGGSGKWCLGCGAVYAPDASGRHWTWRRTAFADRALDLDGERRASDRPEPGPESDSDAKNVIPIKPST